MSHLSEFEASGRGEWAPQSVSAPAREPRQPSRPRRASASGRRRVAYRFGAALAAAVLVAAIGPAAPAAATEGSGDGCAIGLTGDGTVSGSWAAGCASTPRPGSFARFYTFTLPAQADVEIDLRSQQDAYLYLRSGDDVRSGPRVAYDDDSGSGTNSRIADELAPGTYTIEATTYNSRRTGAFELEVSGLDSATARPQPVPVTPDPAPAPNDDGCGATLNGDGVVTGEWARGCESSARAGSFARFYAFTLSAPTRTDFGLSSTADTYLFLRRGSDVRSGEVLRHDDDGGSGTNSRLHDLLPAGSYTIEATTYSRAQTGAFELRVSGLGAAVGTPDPVTPDPVTPDPVTPDPVTPDPETGPTSVTPDPVTAPSADGCGATLVRDGVVTGEWASGCDSSVRPGSRARFYTFTLSQPARRAEFALSSTVDTYLYLRSGSDVRSGEVLRRDDDGGSGTNSRLWDRLEAGSYTIEATTFDQGRTGDFELEVSGLVTAIVTPGPVTDPVPVTDPTPTTDATPTTDPAPSADGCGATLDGDGAVTGQWVSECVSSTRAGSRARFYTFTLVAEERVAIDLRSDVHTYLYLRDGDDERSGYWSRRADGRGHGPNSRILETLRAGTYTIEATTISPNLGGEFTVELRTGTGTALSPHSDPGTCGVVLSGDTLVAGRWSGSQCVSTSRPSTHARYYTFTLASRAQVEIDLRSELGAHSTPTVDTYLILRRGNDARLGDELSSDDDGGASSDARIVITLAPGTYTIEATTYRRDETGSFTLELSGAGTAAAPPRAGSATPDPVSVTCGRDLAGDDTVSGEWGPDCWSSGRAYLGTYARFFTFTVQGPNPRLVTIDLRSGYDPYLYLRRGSDARSGSNLDHDDDGGRGNNSRISATLAPGTYTIEATTYRFVEGAVPDFTLSVQGTG